MTRGLYYRAASRPSLEQIFDNIGRLEKTKIQVRSFTHYNERYAALLFPALGLVLISTIAGFTRFAKLP
jgi:Ca-activated chloride channel family protein